MERLIPLAEFRTALGGISKSTYYRGVASGVFPPLTKITERRGGIPESVAERIISERIAAAEESRAEKATSK